jgi:hypothetical protein
MTQKRERGVKVSSGNRKNHEGENRKRREAVHVDAAISDFVRKQANRRWPESWQEEKYAEMNADKHANRGRAGGKRIKPREVTWPLIHELAPALLDKLLTAASFKLKRVRRDPGFVLIRQWNLKNRPLEFI